MVQIGEAAFHQGAHKVERERGSFVAAEHQLRIGMPRGSRELRTIDVVAAIRRQTHAVASFQIGGTGLGVLSGKTANPNHRSARADREHHRHLQQHLQGVGDTRGGAIDEALRAIAGLQDELTSGGRFGQLSTQMENLPTGDQGR